MSDIVQKQLAERYKSTSFLNFRLKFRLWRHKYYWTSRSEKIPYKWFIRFHKWNRERKSYYNCLPEKSWFGKDNLRHSLSCQKKDGYICGVTIPYYGGVDFKIGRWRLRLKYLNQLKDRIKFKLGLAIPHAHCDMWVCTRCGLKVYMSCGDMHYDWDKRKSIGCKISHSNLVGKYEVNHGLY